MNNEYVIINKAAIEKRIEETNNDIDDYYGHRKLLKQILSQSTPLITKQLIHTNNYLLVVDDSGIKEGDLCIDMNGIIFKHENHFPVSIGQRKITHHLLLNTQRMIWKLLYVSE